MRDSKNSPQGSAGGRWQNMIKQMQLDLHADRTSTHDLGSNQLRLWFSAFAYLLLERMRALCLHGTELARASLGTIRLRLLKIAGQVSVKRAPGACAHGQQLSAGCALRAVPAAAGGARSAAGLTPAAG